MTELRLADLLAELVGMRGTFILRNAHGAMELVADDLYSSAAGEYLTLYERGAANPESKSHLHLKWRSLRSARIEREAEHTPHLAFYAAAEPEGEALLLWYFPSFYDYENGGKSIPENVARYEKFVSERGSALRLTDRD